MLAFSDGRVAQDTRQSSGLGQQCVDVGRREPVGIDGANVSKLLAFGAELGQPGMDDSRVRARLDGGDEIDRGLQRGDGGQRARDK
jgi:hypothetical protein